MKRLSLVVSFCMLFVIICNATIPVKGQDLQTDTEILSVISTDNQSILLEFNAPTLRISDRTENGHTCSDIQFGNNSRFINQQPNGLPYISKLLGVPANTSYQIEIIDQLEEIIPTVNAPCPVDTQPISDPGSSTSLFPDIVPEPGRNRQIELTNEPVVSITQQGYFRYQPVIQVQVSPIQFDRSKGQFRVTHKMTVKISFDPSEKMPSNSLANNLTSLDFDPLLQANISNYQDARQWQLVSNEKSAVLLNSLDELAFYKIVVNSPGIYNLTYDALLAAGLPLATIDPRNLHLLKENTEVPISIIGEEDGVINPGDSIQFYGEPVTTQYNNEDIYRLFWDNKPGLRIAINEGTIQHDTPLLNAGSHWKTSHYETDASYMNNLPSGNNLDHWYWNYVYAAGKPASISFLVNVENITNDGETHALFKGLLKSYAANPKHHTKIYLNNQLAYDTLWDIGTELQFNVQIPLSYLLNGSNTITVEAPADEGITQDLAFINWFELEYPSTFQAINDRLVFNSNPGAWNYEVKNFSNNSIEIFDISDPYLPKRINGSTIKQEGSTYTVSFSGFTETSNRYLVQTTSQRMSPASITITRNENHIRSADNGADYIIITPDNFLSAAQNLAGYRAGQGLRTKVIPVQEIYDQFSNGLSQPEAVQAFITYAFKNWQPPAPLYVLLLGDGHYDYKNLLKRNETNFILPLLADVDPWIGETSVDNRLAAVNGNDIFPDLYIGRLPVKTLTEANAVVDKIQLYESKPAEEWNLQTVFVADNSDNGGNFAASNDYLSGLLPGSYLVNKINYIDPLTTPISTVRASIISNFNAGRGLVVYSGHGSIQFWADEGLFQRKYIPSLNPSTMYPFVVSFTCMDGYFITPSTATTEISSLAESLVRAPDRGAIAAFSPTGWGLVEGHDILATGLFEAIFTHGINRAGAATTYAKYYLAAHSASHRELIDTYTLFGDPALQLKLGPQTTPAQADLSVQLRLTGGTGEPGEWIDVQLDYANLGGVPAEGVTLSLPLPAQLLDAVITTDPLLAQHAGAPFTFLLTTLNPGESGKVSLHARIDPLSTSKINLRASIASASMDADLTNNNATLALGSADYHYWIPMLVSTSLNHYHWLPLLSRTP